MAFFVLNFLGELLRDINHDRGSKTAGNTYVTSTCRTLGNQGMESVRIVQSLPLLLVVSYNVYIIINTTLRPGVHVHHALT
jgi:hypothetical protein